MDVTTVRVRLPLLARLMLGELADRRGQDEGTLLADLIRRETLVELGNISAQLQQQVPAREEK